MNVHTSSFRYISSKDLSINRISKFPLGINFAGLWILISGNTDSTVPARSSTPTSSKSSQSIVTEHHITVPIKTNHNLSITNHCNEFNSTTIILIIGGIVILLLILIIIFQIYERNCKNRERKLPAVHVQSRLYENTTEPVPCYINDFYGRMEANSLQASGITEDI